MTSPLLAAPAAAEYLNLAPSTLAKMRVRGEGPPFCKLGARVAYRIADVDAFLEATVRRSTSDSATSAA